MYRSIFSIYDEKTGTYGPVFSDADFHFHVDECVHQEDQDPSTLILYIVAIQDPSTGNIESVESLCIGPCADYQLSLKKAANRLH